MVLNTFKCNHLTSLQFKGLKWFSKNMSTINSMQYGTWSFVRYNDAMVSTCSIHYVLSWCMIAADKVRRWRPHMTTHRTIHSGSVVRAAEYRLATIDWARIHCYAAYNCSLWSAVCTGLKENRNLLATRGVELSKWLGKLKTAQK